ncbi:hypothetical protein POSPLADRAFT_1043327 [Postia placenta MAD-698-R-SB12]|uniref:Uncharacterized protein n=1 Tax=Postia placenta MAD-698-R-SB12 TaxID=670580 RepID=A0A1X6NAN0_9APHY|nr:hypothetical protein POSPLADRAFT_1043327 [Postia placenta MAD-698-R-SB12]OSX65695.1 hypothetical protein POSPLADRAFT_1043327 [Postia placenta MAD-698-R-SB12]
MYNGIGILSFTETEFAGSGNNWPRGPSDDHERQFHKLWKWSLSLYSTCLRHIRRYIKAHCHFCPEYTKDEDDAWGNVECHSACHDTCPTCTIDEGLHLATFGGRVNGDVGFRALRHKIRDGRTIGGIGVDGHNRRSRRESEAVYGRIWGGTGSHDTWAIDVGDRAPGDSSNIEEEEKTTVGRRTVGNARLRRWDVDVAQGRLLSSSWYLKPGSYGAASDETSKSTFDHYPSGEIDVLYQPGERMAMFDRTGSASGLPQHADIARYRPGKARRRSRATLNFAPEAWGFQSTHRALARRAEIRTKLGQGATSAVREHATQMTTQYNRLLHAGETRGIRTIASCEDEQQVLPGPESEVKAAILVSSRWGERANGYSLRNDRSSHLTGKEWKWALQCGVGDGMNGLPVYEGQYISYA